MIHTGPELYRSVNYLACKDFASPVVRSAAVGQIVTAALINLAAPSHDLYSYRLVKAGLGARLLLCTLVCVSPVGNTHV